MAKLQIPRFQRPHSGRETASNICKWFILAETRFIDVRSAADSTLIYSSHAIICENRTPWV